MTTALLCPRCGAKYGWLTVNRLAKSGPRHQALARCAAGECEFVEGDHNLLAGEEAPAWMKEAP